MGTKRGTSKYIGQTLKGFKIVEYFPAQNGSNPKFRGICTNCGREIIRSKSGFLQENSRIRCVCNEAYSHHNQSHTRLYSIHQNMKRRCYNPNSDWWELYGGKGVRVCDEWLGKYGFINFRDWALSNGYADNLTIDRINSDGNYEPSNCRWATPKEQNFNTNRTLFATINGVTKPMMEWCEEYGIAYQCVRARLRRGWSIETAITTHKKQQRGSD